MGRFSGLLYIELLDQGLTQRRHENEWGFSVKRSLEVRVNVKMH